MLATCGSRRLESILMVVLEAFLERTPPILPTDDILDEAVPASSVNSYASSSYSSSNSNISFLLYEKFVFAY